MSLCLPMFLVLLLCTFLLFVCFVLGYLGVFYFNLGNYLFSHGRNREREGSTFGLVVRWEGFASSYGGKTRIHF